jgi:gluconokinase
MMKLHHTHTIVASGGFIQNERWLQLLADIFCKRVVVRDDDDASALGAIMIGFQAIGQSVSFESAYIKTYDPSTTFADAYQNRYAIFKELYSMHKHHFSILNSLHS